MPPRLSKIYKKNKKRDIAKFFALKTFVILTSWEYFVTLVYSHFEIRTK